MATMKTLNGYGFNATELNGKTSDNYLKKTDTASDSKKLGGKAPEYYIHPRNLLDNSDFTNPVNQRGQSSYTVSGYCVDRWRTGMGSGTTAYAVGGILQLGKKYGQFVQELPEHYERKALTFAIYLSDVSSGDIIAIVNDGYSQSSTVVHQGLNIVTHTVRSNSTTLFAGLQNNDQSSDQSCTPVWAALYEGAYTADTLPPYVPKGYAAELAECLRYFERLGETYSDALGNAVYATSNAASIIISIHYSPKRIKRPTIVMSDVSQYRVLLKDATNCNTYSAFSLSAFGDIDAENSFGQIKVAMAGNLSQDSWLVLQRSDAATGAYIDVSADL